MARIKLGPVVTDIAGSVGGMTIQRNKFGMTMRAKPLPLYSETPAQYTIRRNIAYLQYSWQALTDAQRLQWNRFLDFSGQTIRRDRSILLSGQALYLKYQLWRLLSDQSLLTTIAYTPMPDYPDFLGVIHDTGVLTVHFSANVVSTSYFFFVKLSSPRLENQAYNPRGLRWMHVNFATAMSYVITPAWLVAFGVLPPVTGFLHYSILWFSIVSPVFSGAFTGKLQIVDETP